MATESILSLLEIPDKLRRRNITKDNGYAFSAKWIVDLIRYFEAETAARSVTYPARIYLDGWANDGEIEVSRDGDLIVRLNH